MNKQLNLGHLNGSVLIFGGPYSNLAATLAIKAESLRLNIPADRVICTGDVVAYCAQPEETAEVIRNWGIPAVRGNCEESLGLDAPDCGCGFGEGTTCETLSAGWYSFASNHISESSRQWMRTLPRTIKFELLGRSFLVVHGGVTEINRFIFHSTDPAIIERELNEAETDVVIGGHCGLPFGKKIDKKFWINAGAIGMPANDGTKDGWYTLLEQYKDHIRISWNRLVYPSQLTYQAMEGAGLINDYAEALYSGLWPSMDVLPDEERLQQGQPITLSPLYVPSRSIAKSDQINSVHTE